MKKSKKPVIEITKSYWYHTKKPCFLTSYNEYFGDYIGHGCGYDTLKEAFDALESFCRQRGYELSDCQWSEDSDYKLKDRPDKVICDTNGQMLFNF